MNNISGIYQIQSKCKPEKVYIGSAINITKRWKSHLYELRKNKHANSKLQFHYDKYGEPDLQFSVLLGCEKEELIKNEQFFIDSYNPWFNINKIAGSNLGRKWSEESKRKMGESHKGEKAWWFGKHHTDESKEKIRIAHLGTKVSEETILKLKIAHTKENSGFHGKKHTEEAKRKMSEANKGRVYSAETLLKRSISLTGIKRTEECKQKLSLRMKGVPKSEEHKRKLSEANIGHVNSDEARRKISEANKGRFTGENNPMYGKIYTEEEKQKMRDRMTGENNPMYGKHISEEAEIRRKESWRITMLKKKNKDAIPAE